MYLKKEEWALNGEVTTFEFKIRAEDADENTYKTIYLNVYKANEDTNLEKVEVRYTRNNVEGTVQAVKGENGEYNAWISSDKTSDVLVDLIAQAANAGAMVQIDGNTQLHQDIQMFLKMYLHRLLLRRLLLYHQTDKLRLNIRLMYISQILN